MPAGSTCLTRSYMESAFRAERLRNERCGSGFDSQLRTYAVGSPIVRSTLEVVMVCDRSLRSATLPIVCSNIGDLNVFRSSKCTGWDDLKLRTYHIGLR
jgi:hypothetical protein